MDLGREIYKTSQSSRRVLRRPFLQRTIVVALLLAFLVFLGSSTGCILHPISGGENARQLLGLSEDSNDAELEAALLALLSEPGDALPSVIYLYDGGITDGDMGGRSGANAICDGSVNKPPGTTGVAFLSTSDQALISLPGVPAGVPVIGPGGMVASSWSSLFGYGNTLQSSLYDAGVLAFPSEEFYSGTAPDGIHEPSATCLDWQSNISDDQGAVGRADLASDDWISWTDPANCDFSYHLICASW
ncbi:MAG: hypothetical protein KDK25_06505 [Leptospiraceae bacterium]|nr:hypothetical protein [Leptospiraceae bacterium]